MKILSGFEKAPLRKLSALIGQMKVQRILEITQGQKSSQQLEEIRKSIAKTPKCEFRFNPAGDSDLKPAT